MVKAVLHKKNNPDEHYANVFLKFLKEGAQKNEKPVTFISADAKSKVLIGQSEFPVAPVNHSKKVTIDAT